MEAQAAPHRAKKRRSEALGSSEPEETAGISSPAVADAPNPNPPGAEGEQSRRQEPEPGAGGSGGGEEYGADHISRLPDAVLGEVVSLLPTKDGARTQILSSRWRHIWRAAPLNLDSSELPADNEALAGAISRILSGHPGPGRRFSIPPRLLHRRPDAVDGWLQSPALDNLQELDFSVRQIWFLRRVPPASTFRFSATLRVATFSNFDFPDATVEALHFPQLSNLALQCSSISEVSLHAMISSCPVLECLMLNDNYGCCCVRISSNTLRSIGVGADLQDFDDGKPRLREVVIVNAPCLKRFLHLQRNAAIDLTVIAAPKLETLGCLIEDVDSSRFVFGTMAIKGFRILSLTTGVCNVKILAVKSYQIKLDTCIDLMKCFPCLEKLYIKCAISGSPNRWRRKHRDFVKCSDIHLKTIVLEKYQGTRSQVNFASFFLLNARKLELMRLQVEDEDYNEAFFAEQHGFLQMEKRASRGARLHFTADICHRYLTYVDHVRDLSITDPFECRC